jgi:hypothetical protein
MSKSTVVDTGRECVVDGDAEVQEGLEGGLDTKEGTAQALTGSSTPAYHSLGQFPYPPCLACSRALTFVPVRLIVTMQMSPHISHIVGENCTWLYKRGLYYSSYKVHVR